MKKGLLLFLIASGFSYYSHAQICPGTSFSTAVLFDGAWLSACVGNTGGQEFSNEASCEPTTAIDPCAPAPNCGGTPGSDLWFRFFADMTTATIQVNPTNGGLAAGIQVFSTMGITCGDLTQIACAAGANNATLTLNLTGLTVGNQYYFRVYGQGNNASLRDGQFNFCGSVAISSTILPVKLLSFHARINGNSVVLDWTSSAEENFSRYEIERSNTGSSFTSIGSKTVIPSTGAESRYSFTDLSPHPGVNFYRLKMIDVDGKYSYSAILQVNPNARGGFRAFMDHDNRRLVVISDKNAEIEIFSSTGAFMNMIRVSEGINSLYSDLPTGVYIVRRKDTGESVKIASIR